MRSFGEYLHGKTVSIIGGAKVFDADAFDADVVIRINEHAVTQGGKADIIYSTINVDPEILFTSKIANSLRWFMADKNGRYFNGALAGRFKAHNVGFDTFETCLNNNIETFNLSEFWLQRAVAQYDCKPFTGIVAMVHALANSPRKVFLTGCNFYAREGRVPLHRDSHFIEPNRQIVRDALKWDKRLTVDPQCLESLDYPVLK